MESVAQRSNRDSRWFRRLSLLWMAAVMLAATTARADIFFWQDDQGVIHFSNQAAPPEASLYMHEPEPVAAPRAAPSPESGPSAIQHQMQASLERANEKLERALERVTELSEKVRDSQQEAAVAAAVARQAAELSKAGAEQAARVSDREANRRVVYYAVPGIRRSLSGPNGSHGKPPHFSHRKYKHLNKFKRHAADRQHVKSRRPGRVVQPKIHSRPHNSIRHNGRLSTIHRSRIPKAYGIR